MLQEVIAECVTDVGFLMSSGHHSLLNRGMNRHGNIAYNEETIKQKLLMSSVLQLNIIKNQSNFKNILTYYIICKFCY